MKKQIVITSIFLPTEAVRRFASMPGYQLTVVGDQKTPLNWSCPGVRYMSVANQLQNESTLSRHLPWNHYSRKMLGYLDAIEQGAIAIVDTDDDNIPKLDFAFPEIEGEFNCTAPDQGIVNVYQYFTRQPIWPRGLPLDQIRNDDRIRLNCHPQKCSIGVWQGLADEDPDVDAVYRLTDGSLCWFEEKPPLVLASGTVAPFNSQNTFVRPELYPLLYLPAYVSFRFTDILRGLIAQPIMALYDYKLGFTNATVTQKRNPHDYMQDFASEVPMYLKTRKVLSVAQSTVRSEWGVSGNLYEVYLALQKLGLVEEQEMIALNAWLEDLQRITSSVG